MKKIFSKEAQEIMNKRFNQDSLIALATISDNTPYVRTVDGYYEDGAFYIITYLKSNKMIQIMNNPTVAISGDWFTAHGVGENMGYILDEKNKELFLKLKKAFAKWYDNGHIDEKDHNNCILCIHLTEGVLFADEKRYEIDFKYKE